MPEFHKHLPHGDLQEVFPDVFVLQGTFDMAPLVRITRNMIVLRHEGSLCVVNAVRLSDEGAAALDALGKVEHLFHIGFGHGADNPWYADRYKPVLWAPEGMRWSGGLAADKVVGEDDLPVLGMSAFVFREGARSEAVLHLDREGGILVSCDSLQNWTDTRGCSPMAAAVTHLAGFMKKASPGGPWLKMMQKRGSIRADYDRLLGLEFRHLVPGHGSVNRDSAKEDVQASVRRIWG